LCMALVPLVVGGLKTLTNVDCPWDVAGFGGTRPYVEWYLPRPDGLPHAACFPGAHSSSAFALFALYFLWRDPYPQRAQVALVGVLVLGGLFSLAQQSRGAHFLSHDLASALIAWLMCFGFYLKFFEGENKRHAPHD
ncbi:MAG: phosphatase PAP2 family protein, partial [Gammaproteobacteria bacterium]